MPMFEVELEIGQTLKLGDKMVTLIDIEGEEISLRIEEIDPSLELLPGAHVAAIRGLPR